MNLTQARLEEKFMWTILILFFVIFFASSFLIWKRLKRLKVSSRPSNLPSSRYYNSKTNGFGGVRYEKKNERVYGSGHRRKKRY